MAQQSVVANLPTGSNQQTTPEELQSRADYVANSLMAMTEGQKDSELHKLKQSDPTLHALVRSKMDEIRRGAASQGKQQVLAQQYQKQGGDLAGVLGQMRKLLTLVRMTQPNYGLDLVEKCAALDAAASYRKAGSLLRRGRNVRF